MPMLEDLQNKQADLVRKMTAASLFLAPMTADLPETLTSGASADLVALPTGYTEMGLVTKDDGYTLGRETEMSEVTSHGYVDPTRRDILRTTNTFGFTAQETSRQTIELYRNVDLSSAAPTAVTGEIAFSEPLAPTTRYYRAFLIGRDGTGTDAVYVAILYPRAMVSEFGEQSWSDENELNYPFTLTATPDSELGASVRHFFGGPGWRNRLVAMGFPALTP